MSTESHSAVLGPWFEEQIEKNKLKNMEVRYKWRSSAYGYDEEEKAIRLVHFRSLLLHHKLLMVNGQILATGSYNWSSSAEDRNFENIMMHSHQSYSHLDDVKKRLLSYYKMHDFIRGEPKVSIFLTANLTFPVWFKFDKILERALGTS